MRPPGEPFSEMRVASMQILRPGDSIDFHRIQKRYMDGSTLVFEVEGGWTIRVGEGSTLERPGDAVHTRRCSRQNAVPSKAMADYVYCRECIRIVYDPEGFKRGKGDPNLTRPLHERVAATTSVGTVVDSEVSRRGRRIKTIPAQKMLGVIHGRGR